MRRLIPALLTAASMIGCRDAPRAGVGAGAAPRGLPPDLPARSSAAFEAKQSAIRDSIRNRAERQFEARPDSFARKADSARTMGPASATLWVVLVGHLQCARCTDAVREVLPALRREYAERGRVRLAWVFSAAPDTNYNADFAAHAALCAAARGTFWPVLDSIAATRDEWANEPDPQPRFNALAVRLGVDPAWQSTCMYRKLMTHLLNSDEARASAAGVSAPPALLIGSTMLDGTLTLPRARRAIDAALASRR